jgi:hypothetical protein
MINGKYEPFTDQDVMHHYTPVKHLSISILNEGISLSLFLLKDTDGRVAQFR